MDSSIIIDKINKAIKLSDILDLNNLKSEYSSILKVIHPDICNLDGAGNAVSKLNSLRDYYINGSVYNDDNGTMTTNGYFVRFNGNKDFMKKSYDGFKRLKSITPKTSIFYKYLPEEARLNNSDSLEFDLQRRGIPLCELMKTQLPQQHINWILSRLLEFSTWLQRNGFVHAGLNPQSIFITPEDHGIQIVSFYHMCTSGHTIKSVSATYKHWYPEELFKTKITDFSIDVELSKKIAILLFGDKSGSGIKFRKTHNPDFVNFIIEKHYDSIEAFMQYRSLLQKNFEKKFHILNY